ncbi:MAG: M1 family aminopeptidase [Pseudomonadota bacterium]
MLGKIAGFETRYQITSPAFIIIFLLFFLFSFAAVSLDEVQIGSGGNVNANAPFAITFATMIMSLFAIIIPTVFLSSSVLRDSASKMDGILFSTPVKKGDYMLGRFSGAFIIVMLAFASVPLGLMVGSFMPWLDPETLGPFRPVDYLYALFVIGLPNMLFVGILMFVIANVSRSTLATYIGLVGFFVLYLVSESLPDKLEFRTIAALSDPLGGAAWGEATRNWTAFERNTKLVPLEGLFLANRALWFGISILLLVVNFLTFSFRKAGKQAGKTKDRGAARPQRFLPTRVVLPRVTQNFASARTARQQFFARTRFEVRAIFFSITFWVLIVLGLSLALLNILNTEEIFGTPVLPVTQNMVSAIVSGFGFVPFVVVIFYAADLVWRDHGAKMHEIVESAPTPSWAFIFPKILAIGLVVLVLFVFSALLGAGYQMVASSTAIEWDQYLIRLVYITGWPLILTAILAVFFQVLFNNRYLGLLAMLVFYIGILTLGNLGFEHNLYQYAQTPGGGYSDMNGYGHFLGIRTIFNVYWTFVAIILLALSYGLWSRGTLTALGKRIGGLGAQLGVGSSALMGVSAIAAIATGAYIFYNTNIVNDYRTSKDEDKLAVDYENRYGALKEVAQPKIIAVSTNVDIFPAARRVEVAGSYVLENKTDSPIDRVHVEYDSGLEIPSQSLAGGTITERDDLHKVYFYDLATPMEPGERRTLSFTTRLAYEGFRNSRNGVTVVENGTFVNNLDIMPAIGFQPGRLLTDRNDRRKYDLEEIDRMPKLEDTRFHNQNYLRADSDFVTFEATLSTAEDQTAIAPGYLEREWQENGRRYFSYKMDVPILNFFSFQSARYAVREDKWKDVAIQIFYHEPHAFNVDRMIEATKKSFDYFTENFSPFQYRQMRILEFPYRTFAQSFPNTVPFSERIGFIADNTNPDKVDSTFYVTSHEVAHQWWAHQVMGANVQGGAMLVETFAQYSAFMAVEKEFGPEHVRDFLTLELDRYLSARGTERIEELPLYRVENQGYIHYRKGSLVMYALKDYVGEAVVNRALQRLIALRGFQSAPYATSTDFLKILREEAGPTHDDLITDLFEKITLYDLKAESVEVEERDDQRFDVTLTYDAKKFYADGVGEETSAPITIPIDIGVFLKSPADSDFEADDVLYLEKHTVSEQDPTITITVDKRPTHAGIDPYVKLIDRDADNNVMRVN